MMPNRSTFAAAAWFLAATLAAAQTPEPTPEASDMPSGMAVPEGFDLQTTAMTAEELLGATIYDSNNDFVGEIGDLVLVHNAGGTLPAGREAPSSGGTGTGLPGNDGTAAESPPTAPETPAGQAGEISHAVLDIGGFLGLGEHQIALPVSDLQIFRSDTDDLRVYVAWTREQLGELPTYDPDDPSTLGRPLVTP